ncbi:hypothetical protein Tco_0041065 [Tanacetum coccineum]
MANSWRAKMEAMRAELARNHEEIIYLSKKYAISIGRAKEVEEWEKWHCNDGSRLAVACSDEEIIKSPTQPATTEKSSEDGGNLEELILTSAVDKGDFTGPILAVKEDLGQKLTDDLDEPLMVLESDGMINKNEFAVVAPVVAVAPIVVAPIALFKSVEAAEKEKKIPKQN